VHSTLSSRHRFSSSAHLYPCGYNIVQYRGIHVFSGKGEITFDRKRLWRGIGVCAALFVFYVLTHVELYVIQALFANCHPAQKRVVLHQIFAPDQFGGRIPGDGVVAAFGTDLAG